jgi:hypothetical protein
MGWVELLFPPYFVNVFKHDKLHIDTERDRAFIGDGNISAHHGDPTVDARLYLTNGRQDDEVFTELYELNTVRVSFIGKSSQYFHLTITLIVFRTSRNAKFTCSACDHQEFKVSNGNCTFLPGVQHFHRTIQDFQL